MKKTLLLVLGILMAVTALSFSQTQSGAAASSTASAPVDAFVKTVPIVKVYTHSLGYKVIYLKNDMSLSTLYLPLTWFGRTAGKGEIVWEPAGEPSYFSVFWIDGKFDHIVLHIPANMQSSIFGVLETTQDMSTLFNIDEPKLSF